MLSFSQLKKILIKRIIIFIKQFKHLMSQYYLLQIGRTVVNTTVTEIFKCYKNNYTIPRKHYV